MATSAQGNRIWNSIRDSRAEAALKGHGFSRAETCLEKRAGFSLWGMFWGLNPIPQGLKARQIHGMGLRHG
jgi:hypothetical protein